MTSNYLQSLNDYDGQVFQACCLNMMMRISWYLSQELRTLAISNIVSLPGLSRPILKNLGFLGFFKNLKHNTFPRSLSDLRVTRTSVKLSAYIDDSFILVPVESYTFL